MTIDGNYVNGDVLNPMLQGIMNQQTAGIDDYAYSYAVAMCLMPTEFCVSPRNVGLERSSMECSSTQWFPSKSPSTCWPAETTRNSSFAVISEKPASIPSPRTFFPKIPLIFRLNQTGSFLECWKPVLLNQNETFQLRIASDFWNSSNRQVFFEVLRILANHRN